MYLENSVSEWKGVVVPGPSRAKRRVNEQLIQIKEEILLDDDRPRTGIGFEYSQPIHPQQFYADINVRLDGLNREDYTKKLLSICNNDYCKLIDYRDWHAERAKTHPVFPQTCLENRSNSVTDKFATACYVLYAFNQAVHNRDITSKRYW